MKMTEEQIQWLLAIVSAAPIQTTTQARIKADWLNEIADQLEEQAKVKADKKAKAEVIE
jgi:hypothetical protein